MTGRPRYALIACHLLWRELSLLAAQAQAVIYPVFMEQGLHSEPSNLQKKVQQEIDRLDGQYDAILIGYGLCSNGICGLRARQSRLVAVRAHDCITLLLGGKELYQSYFRNNPGTYWYSASWIETGHMPGQANLQASRQRYEAQYDEETAEFLIDQEYGWMRHYRQACYISQAALAAADDAYRRFTRQCAGECGWQYAELEGDMSLLQDLVGGNWDPERFLVVEPGQCIAASFDETILVARPAD